MKSYFYYVFSSKTSYVLLKVLFVWKFYDSKYVKSSSIHQFLCKILSIYIEYIEASNFQETNALLETSKS